MIYSAVVPNRRCSSGTTVDFCRRSRLAAGYYPAEAVNLYGIGLPFMIAGIWSGFKLYGTIDDETFRKAVLVLVLIAGVSLVASAAGLMPVSRGEVEDQRLLPHGNGVTVRVEARHAAWFAQLAN